MCGSGGGGPTGGPLVPDTGGGFGIVGKLGRLGNGGRGGRLGNDTGVDVFDAVGGNELGVVGDDEVNGGAPPATAAAATAAAAAIKSPGDWGSYLPCSMAMPISIDMMLLPLARSPACSIVTLEA